jgi:hypothetical protein
MDKDKHSDVFVGLPRRICGVVFPSEPTKPPPQSLNDGDVGAVVDGGPSERDKTVAKEKQVLFKAELKRAKPSKPKKKPKNSDGGAAERAAPQAKDARDASLPDAGVTPSPSASKRGRPVKVADSEPWKSEGISRTTWYRRQKKKDPK